MSPDSAPKGGRVGILLWTAGMVGAVAVAVGMLPALAEKMPLPAPLWLLIAASATQSAVLIALAAWAGTRLAPSVGLHSPMCEAIAARQPAWAALRPQLLPGLIGGVPGGLLLFVSLTASPGPIAALQQQYDAPLYARVLYGGITEEVLLRWGLMTFVAWLVWRFVQGKRGGVHAGLMWIAIAVTAVVFGAGHLPLAHYLLGTLTVPVVFFVIGVNAGFGILFGWLYWRRGLESAMVAHAVTHLVGYVAVQLAARP